MSTPTINELQRYGVNIQDAATVIYQPLYDTLEYPVAGIGELTFFQKTSGSTPGGKEVTNMEVTGALPSPKNMLVRAIELKLIGATYEQHIALENRGHIQFYVGSTSYLDEVGFGTFPTENHTEADFAAATTTADTDIQLENAYYKGRLFKIEPLRLEPNMNFNLSVKFPDGVVPIGGDDPIKIRARLLGHQFRLAQV